MAKSPKVSMVNRETGKPSDKFTTFDNTSGGQTAIRKDWMKDKYNEDEEKRKAKLKKLYSRSNHN